MKLPKQLMEAISQVCDELEQTASGMFAPKRLMLDAEYEDDGVTYKVVLTNDGGRTYLGEWDIDVSVRKPEDTSALDNPGAAIAGPTASKTRTPRKAASRPQK